MNRIATIAVDLPLNDGVQASVREGIEVSLDCSDCQRKGRTVGFRKSENHGVCTPSGHWFRGILLDIRQRDEDGRFAVEYDVEYQYEPFVDAKYPDQLPYYGPSDGVPTWARVYFTLTCPRCQAITTNSTQSNMVRPHTETCKCGYDLYRDEVPPILSWHNAGAA
jgi:hypothetical protein